MMQHLKKQRKTFPSFTFLSQCLAFSSSTKNLKPHQNPLSTLTNIPSHPSSNTNAITFSPSKAHLYASFFCTLIHLYLACGRFSKASETFFSMRNHGIIPILHLWNRLLYEFNASGLVPQVWILYNDMLTCGVLPNVFTSNILVHSLCKVGELDLALDLLRSAEIDTVTYNTVIWGLCKQGLVYRAFAFLSEMVKKGVCIDSIYWLMGFAKLGW